MLDLSQPKGVHIDQRLRSELIMWLSTVRPDGRPHLVPIGFYWDGSCILAFSEPRTQKIRNLRHQPQALLSLEAADQGRDIVIIEAQAELLPTGEATPMLPGYAEKYRELLTSLGTTAEAIAQTYTQAMRFVPLRFR